MASVQKNGFETQFSQDSVSLSHCQSVFEKTAVMSFTLCPSPVLRDREQHGSVCLTASVTSCRPDYVTKKMTLMDLRDWRSLFLERIGLWGCLQHPVLCHFNPSPPFPREWALFLFSLHLLSLESQEIISLHENIIHLGVFFSLPSSQGF